ncbi:MAG: electron transfer flavoprotein subunit beta/FixA family protein [Syntrophomonadaceae bacterium]|jgi:electron transfer flavoprotein beta subunit|nr:electron transfer flavoprotein subunit beta/FixA family protein [Syntrophomonadaceae bacterium]
MNIVVAMKQIPDLQQIRIRERKPVLSGVPLTFGLIDKNALEAGIQLKEAVGGNLIVVSAGNEELEETVKEALAVGADEAYLAADNALAGLDSSQNAQILAALIRKIDTPDIIIFGEGSGDNYSGQVGTRVAEILGLPSVAYVSRIEVKDHTARLVRSLEDADELIEVQLPCIITVLGDINEPRLPSVTQVLKAGKKRREVFALSDLGIELSAKTISTISDLAPVSQRKQIAVKSLDELLNVLQTEGFLRR